MEGYNDGDIIQLPENQDKYMITRRIGTAPGAIVYRAVFIPIHHHWADPSFNSDVALKILQEGSPECEIAKQRLEGIAFDTDHENLLPVTTCFEVDNKYFIVMPFMAGGSLRSIMSHSFRNGFPVEWIKIALYKILQGLSFLHQRGKLHREIRAEHIFVDARIPSFIALSFGGLVYEEDNPDTKPALLDAPESTLNYTVQCDTWLIGITALELAYGIKLPTDEQELRLLIEKDIRGESTKRKISRAFKKIIASLQNVRRVSGSFRRMVVWCLKSEPGDRPTAEQLMGHEFFQNRGTLQYLRDTLGPNLHPNPENVVN